MKFTTKLASVAGIVTAGMVGVGAGTASAGCGMTLEFHNRGTSTVTVDLADSDVRTRTFGINPWKRIGTGTRTVGADDIAYQAFTADLGCSHDRDWRFEVNEGSNSWFVDAGTASGDRTLHVHVER